MFNKVIKWLGGILVLLAGAFAMFAGSKDKTKKVKEIKNKIKDIDKNIEKKKEDNKIINKNIKTKEEELKNLKKEKKVEHDISADEAAQFLKGFVKKKKGK